MNLGDDDFKLFGLPMQQHLDPSIVDERWRTLQAAAHPDRFTTDGAASQRLAMQWATRINQARLRLKDPVSRAAYLCELQGVPIDAERNTAMPADFLMQQMQWREGLDEADGVAQVQALSDDVSAAEKAGLLVLESLLDGEHGQGDSRLQQAAAQVRAMMFLRRFRQDLDQRLDALETAR